MIKHESLCNDNKARWLKNVDIPNKIIALQCAWIRWLYDDSFHEWKLIPLYLKTFGYDGRNNFLHIVSISVVHEEYTGG